ncbi:5938_t:CDS:1 [Ambispora gerdemannii]|uniref:5938_t:CDS:1 n=1 Tax=Ambispora gerdemannii TaxID=144530 RepID=A0A9N8UXD8_9GLOM|nr:5938_t:CDS:1 [Ambispora gerdemannii]
MDLNDFVNLESLYLCGEKITDLKIDHCRQLERLNIPQQKNLTSLDISNNLKLVYLNFYGNFFPIQQLIGKIQAKERELANVNLTALTLLNETAKEEEKRKNQLQKEQLEKEIQELISLKTRLETENDNLKKTIGDLKNELISEKRKVDRLNSDYQKLFLAVEELTKQAEASSPYPENQTVQDKIKFFNKWLKSSQAEKEKLLENIKKEQRESQQIRTSFQELEEQLKNSGQSDAQKVQELKKLRDEIKKLEGKLATSQKQVQQLQTENKTKQEEIEQTKKDLGISQSQLAAETAKNQA